MTTDDATSAARRPPAIRPGALVLLGLALLLAALWIWGHPALDLGLHRTLRLPNAPIWARWVKLFTRTGSIPVVAPVLIASAIWLWRRGFGRMGAWLIATVVSGRIVVEVVKHLVHRPRPPLADRLSVENSFSFPSAHAAGVMIAACALVVALRLGWRWRAAAVAFALAIGWSRLALAVHWPSDVLAGWGFGLLWVAGAEAWLPAQPRQLRSTSRNASP